MTTRRPPQEASPLAAEADPSPEIQYLVEPERRMSDLSSEKPDGAKRFSTRGNWHMRPRVGIMGGTFDPIHNGHLVAASEVAWVYDLDEVIFVPTGRPVFKLVFFLGILLSVLFLFATLLMLYYKQVVEGYEDASRFAIMQRVGMTKRDIRESVNAQMLLIFLLPLAAAALHLAFAQPMVWQILQLFGIQNLTLFLGVTGAALLLFALLYCAMYRLTSNAYFRIVSTGGAAA